jgi:hypothetical protein
MANLPLAEQGNNKEATAPDATDAREEGRKRAAESGRRMGAKLGNFLLPGVKAARNLKNGLKSLRTNRAKDKTETAKPSLSVPTKPEATKPQTAAPETAKPATAKPAATAPARSGMGREYSASMSRRGGQWSDMKAPTPSIHDHIKSGIGQIGIMLRSKFRAPGLAETSRPYGLKHLDTDSQYQKDGSSTHQHYLAAHDSAHSANGLSSALRRRGYDVDTKAVPGKGHMVSATKDNRTHSYRIKQDASMPKPYNLPDPINPTGMKMHPKYHVPGAGHISSLAPGQSGQSAPATGASPTSAPATGAKPAMTGGSHRRPSLVPGAESVRKQHPAVYNGTTITPNAGGTGLTHSHRFTADGIQARVMGDAMSGKLKSLGYANVTNEWHGTHSAVSGERNGHTHQYHIAAKTTRGSKSRVGTVNPVPASTAPKTTAGSTVP